MAVSKTSSCALRTLLFMSWGCCLLALIGFISVVVLPLWYIPSHQLREYGELNYGLLGLYEYCPNLKGFPNISKYNGLETDCRWVSFANCRSDVCIFSQIDYTNSSDRSSLKDLLGQNIPNVTASICRNYHVFHPEPVPGMTEETDFLYQLVLDFPGRHMPQVKVGTPCQYYRAIRVLAPFGAAIAATIFLTSTLGVCCNLANSRWVGGCALGLVILNSAIAATCAGLWAGVIYAHLYKDDEIGARPSALGPSFFTLVAAGFLTLSTIPAFCIWATLKPIKEEDEETPPKAPVAAAVAGGAAARAKREEAAPAALAASSAKGDVPAEMTASAPAVQEEAPVVAAAAVAGAAAGATVAENAAPAKEARTKAAPIAASAAIPSPVSTTEALAMEDEPAVSDTAVAAAASAAAAAAVGGMGSTADPAQATENGSLSDVYMPLVDSKLPLGDAVTGLSGGGELAAWEVQPASGADQVIGDMAQAAGGLPAEALAAADEAAEEIQSAVGPQATPVNSPSSTAGGQSEAGDVADGVAQAAVGPPAEALEAADQADLEIRPAEGPQSTPVNSTSGTAGGKSEPPTV